MTAIMITLKEKVRMEAVSPLATHPVEIDMPKTMGGTGADMSPTDLLAASVGSCMLAMMGLLAQKMQVDLAGTKAEVTKMMELQPLKITGMRVVIKVPKEHDPATKKKLEAAALTCPVHGALGPDVKKETVFEWGAA